MVRRDREVNGTIYSIILPPPTQALPLANRALVLLGGFAALLADSTTLGDGNLPKEERLALLFEKFGQVLGKADPVAINALMMDSAFAARLTHSGTESLSTGMAFDKWFEERRSDLYPVLAWCLWECVVDFFPKSGVFTQTLMGGLAGAFRSQTVGPTTTG